MESTKLGALAVTRVVKGGLTPKDVKENTPPLTVVLLHGFGAPGDDLVSLVSAIDVPVGTVFFFPAALHALQDFVQQPMFGDARAWWMIDFAAIERAISRGELRDLSKSVPDGMSEAHAAIVSMLDAIDAKRQSDPSYANAGDRLVLGGFSQGSMLSLDVVLRNSSRVFAGLVVLSGTLVSENEWVPLMKARVTLPVFQSHGQSDPILPFSIAERLRALLQNEGVKVTWNPFAGAHAIPQDTLQRLSAWLRERI